MKIEPRTLWKAIVEEATHTREGESLPYGWRWARLGDITNYAKAKQVKPDKIPEEALVVEMEDMGTCKLLAKRYDRRPKSAKNKFYPGDVLYGKLRTYLRKIWFADEEGYCSTEIVPFRGNDGVDSKFLMYVLISSGIVKWTSYRSYGMDMPRFGTKRALNLLVPLPPIDEQRKIVARLEPLLREVEELDEHYQRYKHAKEVFRKSAIHDAVYFKEGEELPEGWKWVNLGEVCECLDHLRKPVNYATRKTREGNIPYYGATGQIGWIDNYLTNEELVLLGEDAAPFLKQFKDKAYMIDGKAWVNNHAHILRSYYGHVGNRYILYYLNSFNYFGYVWGTTRLKLTKKTMMRIPVPLPPIDQQLRIVSYLDNLTHQIDNMP